MSQPLGNQAVGKRAIRFPVVTVSGSDYEMGCQIGEARREAIRAMYDEVLFAMVEGRPPFGTGLTEDQLMDEARRYISTVEAFAPTVADELRGMSAGSGLTLEQTYVMQVPFAGCGLLMNSAGWREPAETLSKYLAGTAGGCTTFSVTPEVTAGGKVFVGQTCDYLPHYKKYWIILEKIPKNGPSMLNATPGGVLAWGNGMNSAGIGLEYNLLGYPDAKYGLTPFVVGRMIFNATTFEEAVEVALRTERASAWNWMIADETGRTCNLETTALEHEMIEPEDGILTHANCYLTDRFTKEDLSVQLLPDSPVRTTRLRELLAERAGSLGVDYVKSCYEDHLGFPASICRHPVPDVPTHENLDTNVLVISDLQERKLYVCPGPVCEHELVEYTFSGS
ncbi:hypothetical protein IL992_44510 [Microbispora sp. NEAU-D428]|uniref:C45 family autoproteolytic acyltransferase/hydolase n=1 Tax=Microbispora sitophila TaxID=2771537 RepID=UPI001865CC30|nr:C45 family peptidase [Microbispora sitophila]MBE3016163.1 hypothetical protein [Microbispora sitophila]